MSGWPDNLYDGYVPEARRERIFRTKRDMLTWLALEFGKTIHVFSRAWECEVCHGRFPSLEAAQQAPCRLSVAA